MESMAMFMNILFIAYMIVLVESREVHFNRLCDDQHLLPQEFNYGQPQEAKTSSQYQLDHGKTT